MVVFGITGDLSHRYLLPALAQIKKARQLPSGLKILGISRRQISLKEALGETSRALGPISSVLTMNVTSAKDYKSLKTKLKGQNAVFYLAVPPDAVLPIVQNLGQAELNGPSTKLLLEKPFGVDLKSSKALVAQIQKYFEEDKVYRIDHYLAKEVVQNIAIFLGSNVLFRDVWNRQFIDYIEIVAAEKIGIGMRGGFYEQTGALQDMIQSHLLQLAALTLMDPCPHDFDFADLPQRRLAALKKIKARRADFKDSLFRGQYSGYRQEVGNPNSQIETFIALKLVSNDPRWRWVPVYLATGKKLDQKLTQIRINFKKSREAEANRLVLRIQPREGIEIDLWIKEPGYERKLRRIAHSFDYDYHFGRLPDAYEQVIVDVLRGSHTLFASSQEVLESWRIVQPVLNHLNKSKAGLKIYRPGTPIEKILQK